MKIKKPKKQLIPRIAAKIRLDIVFCNFFEKKYITKHKKDKKIFIFKRKYTISGVILMPLHRKKRIAP